MCVCVCFAFVCLCVSLCVPGSPSPEPLLVSRSVGSSSPGPHSAGPPEISLFLPCLVQISLRDPSAHFERFMVLNRDHNSSIRSQKEQKRTKCGTGKGNKREILGSHPSGPSPFGLSGFHPSCPHTSDLPLFPPLWTPLSLCFPLPFWTPTSQDSQKQIDPSRTWPK